MNRTIFRIVLLIAITGILTCAKQLPPPGGPIDTALPGVVRISPAPGTTNVATDVKIEIVFSERMNRKTVEDAIFISPWPAEEIFYHWRGKKLKIDFSDTLKLNRTYVLTIGAKSSDLRNNKMKDSFSMAFSTGEHIDEGQIWGTVYSQSGVEGTLVCAYLLHDSMAVDPVAALADYYTQCNQQGVYQLMYVAPGKYRLFAIKDKDENRRYTRGVDGLGIATTDIMLTENQKRIQNINFQITQEDTIPPMLKSAYAVNQSNIILRFSEELAAFDESAPQNYFSIYPEKDPAVQLSMTACFKSTLEPTTIFLMTEKQSPMTYKMIARNLTDKSRNPLDTLYDSVLFEGSTEIDTLKPRIGYRSISDSSSGIPFAPEIRFGFSEAIERKSFERVFMLKEKGDQVINGKFIWQNPADVSFWPDSLLKSLCHYAIQILPDSIFDLSGNSLNDSLAKVNFKTVNQDTLSAISGEIIDQQEDAIGRFFLNAKSEKNTYQLILDRPGSYRFENILPGIYTISGFRDADSNGVYSFGKINPFIPAERFFFNPDSIKVRSRWPNEENKIIVQ